MRIDGPSQSSDLTPHEQEQRRDRTEAVQRHRGVRSVSRPAALLQPCDERTSFGRIKVNARGSGMTRAITCQNSELGLNPLQLSALAFQFLVSSYFHQDEWSSDLFSTEVSRTTRFQNSIRKIASIRRRFGSYLSIHSSARTPWGSVSRHQRTWFNTRGSIQSSCKRLKRTAGHGGRF